MTIVIETTNERACSLPSELYEHDPAYDAPHVEPIIVPEGERASIAAGLALDPHAQTAAWLHAMGLGAMEIERALGKAPGYLIELRALPDFREMVRRCVRVKAEADVRAGIAGGDVEELFNRQVVPSAATLIEVRDNPFSADSARIKAATEFLDRAPKAPKARKEVDERKTVVVLPVSELQNMRQALAEEGTVEDLEALELIEGVDYAVGEDEGAGAGNDDGQITAIRG